MADKTCRECGKVTLYLSWSGLRTHETCKQRGYLATQKKRANLSDQRNFFPGTVTDRVVRDWLMDDPYNNKGLMPEMVESIVNRETMSIKESGGKMVWRDSKDRDDVIQQCVEAVTKIEPDLERYVLPFEYQADFGFKVPVMMPHVDGTMEKVILLGYMDVLTRNPDNGRYSVYDVKHTKDNYYWKKTVGQLTFYDLSVQLLFGEPTENVGLLQPLCKQTMLPYPATQDERMQIMSRLVRFANDKWRGIHPVRADNKECGFCDYKHACPKFAPVFVDGKKKVSLL